MCHAVCVFKVFTTFNGAVAQNAQAKQHIHDLRKYLTTLVTYRFSHRLTHLRKQEKKKERKTQQRQQQQHKSQQQHAQQQLTTTTTYYRYGTFSCSSTPTMQAMTHA